MGTRPVTLCTCQWADVPFDELCALAKKMGYEETIRQAGGHIFSDTCMDQPCWKFLYGKKGVTDSPKCAYYTRRRQMEFVVVPLEQAVEAALRGEIQGYRK